MMLSGGIQRMGSMVWPPTFESTHTETQLHTESMKYGRIVKAEKHPIFCFPALHQGIKCLLFARIYLTLIDLKFKFKNTSKQYYLIYAGFSTCRWTVHSNCIVLTTHCPQKTFTINTNNGIIHFKEWNKILLAMPIKRKFGSWSQEGFFTESRPKQVRRFLWQIQILH